MKPDSRLTLRVADVKIETPYIRKFVLTPEPGIQLPEFAEGSHVRVFLKNGLIRQYSLCGDPSDRSKYTIAVLRHPDGSGSRYMHENLKPGDALEISFPQNTFRLYEAERYVFIAGGIGITPIISMAIVLEELEKPYILHYCARDPEAMALRSEVESLVQHGDLRLHFDGGNPKNGLDVRAELKQYQAGTHLYCSAPAAMMAAAMEATRYWPRDTVYFEHFTTRMLAVKDAADGDGSRPFRIKIASSSEIFDVEPWETIVDVLRDQGIHIDTLCDEGICGTCVIRYLEGEPDHRDDILDEADQKDYVAVCCARSKSDLLVLDL